MTNIDERLPVRPGHMEAGELAEPIVAYADHLSGHGYTALTIAGFGNSRTCISVIPGHAFR